MSHVRLINKIFSMTKSVKNSILRYYNAVFVQYGYMRMGNRMREYTVMIFYRSRPKD